MKLEIAAVLMKKIKSNDSVKAIFRKSVATAYRAYKNGDSCKQEYLTEYDQLIYRCSLMCD